MPDYSDNTTIMYCVSLTVDGQWGSWGPWGICVCVKDEPGVQLRWRSCDNPLSQNGGQECQGQDRDSRQCNAHNCPGITVVIDSAFKLSC